MSEPRAELDNMQQILLEAKSRWLRSDEICEIIQNCRRFSITPEPPYMPHGGSLFLFDRKALRYFRKDGHPWKKKKDGKTVREAHEKLKYGTVEVLHCYYAHGQDNDNFQRRCYWQLDGPLEHIVLVHYRDLNEETSFGTPQLCNTGSTSQSAQTSSVAGSAYINSSTSVNPASCVPSTSNVDLNIQRASSEFEDANFGDELSCVPPPESVPGSEFQVASLPGKIVTEPISQLTGSTFDPYTASSMNTISLNRSVNLFFSNQVTSHNIILNKGQNVHGTSLAAGTFPLAESVPASGFQVDSLSENIITEPISVLTGSTFHPYTSNSMNTVCLNRSVNPFLLNQVTSHNHILNNGQNIYGTSHAAGTFPLAESVPGFGFQVASLPGNIITKPISVFTGSTFHPYTASSMNTASLNRSVNPFFLNQVASQNLILNKGQNVYGTSPAAGSFGFQFSNKNSPSTCSKSHSLKKKLTITEEQNRLFQQLRCVDALSTRTRDSITQNEESIKINVLPEPYSQPLTIDDIIQVEEKNVEVADHPVNNDGASNDSIQPYNMSPEYKLELASPSDSNEHAEEVLSVFNSSLGMNICDRNPGDLEKLDSFGRWMNVELGNDCLMASDSCSCLNAIDTEKDKVFSRDLQLDVGSVTPSLSQEQLFSINDFSPDWACSGAETKVLISGVFLGGIQPSSIKWCCMFGDVEVSAEVLTTNAIRCQAPPHSPGLVPFYITCNNRLACSEVREFEYRENPPGTEISELFKNESEDETYLQIRFAKMLSLGSDKKRQLCSIENCAKCIVKKNLALMLIDDEPGWEKIEKETKTCQRYLWNLRDALLEKLLKGRLYEWLVCKLHEDGKGPNILDDKGQGAIHLAAVLGYEWAMTSIVVAGVNPSFRDARGRTALHWAAYYGREQTIVTLLELGASPGAIEDPTSKFPVGQTAADLASSSGHKGIAAYLAEADLTGHLTSMSITENVMDSVSASIAAEDAVETVDAQNIIFSDVETAQISLRKSLAAVRNSALAASRIHAAFRAQSFRQRQLTRNAKNYDIACEFMLHPSLKNKPHKMGHFKDYLHASAIKIQQKYRRWKSRKDFLKIRDKIVKIQDIILEENERTRRERISETKSKKKKAHVRGHQVRKQYKKVVWSVGIVEKVILRWRRKRSGLRGFRAEKATGGAEQEVDKADEYDFLHVGRKQKAAGIEKALGRVKSMVRYPEAREQYRRLMECSSKSKVRPVYSLSDQIGSSNEEYLVEDDPFAS